MKRLTKGLLAVLFAAFMLAGGVDYKAEAHVIYNVLPADYGTGDELQTTVPEVESPEIILPENQIAKAQDAEATEEAETKEYAAAFSATTPPTYNNILTWLKNYEPNGGELMQTMSDYYGKSGLGYYGANISRAYYINRWWQMDNESKVVNGKILSTPYFSNKYAGYKLIKSLDTAVHEETHSYAWYMTPEAQDDQAYAMFIKKGRAIMMPFTPVFYSNLAATSVPLRLRTFRYGDYFGTTNSSMVSNRLGPYGLINEFNAYRMGMQQTNAIFDFLKETPDAAYSDWDKVISSAGNDIEAYAEFRFYILYYLQYAKNSSNSYYRTVYQNIMKNAMFKQTFWEVERSYTEEVNEFFNKVKGLPAIVGTEELNNKLPYWVKDYDLLMAEMQNTKYQEVLLEINPGYGSGNGSGSNPGDTGGGSTGPEEGSAFLNGIKMAADGKFYYYEYGKWISTKYGYVDYGGGKFLVANGVVATHMNGLAQDPASSYWYYLSNGQAQTQYTGLASYDGAWFYVDHGMLDTKKNGFVDYDGGKFYVGAGRIMTEVSGLAQNPFDGSWYYLANGQVQTQYTGLAAYDGKWFYIQNGKLNSYFSGLTIYNGRFFLVFQGTVIGGI